MNYNKITSLAELNEALDNEENNFVIALGALRSSNGNLMKQSKLNEP